MGRRALNYILDIGATSKGTEINGEWEGFQVSGGSFDTLLTAKVDADQGESEFDKAQRLLCEAIELITSYRPEGEGDWERKRGREIKLE